MGKKTTATKAPPKTRKRKAQDESDEEPEEVKAMATDEDHGERPQGQEDNSEPEEEKEEPKKKKSRQDKGKEKEEDDGPTQSGDVPPVSVVQVVVQEKPKIPYVLEDKSTDSTERYCFCYDLRAFPDANVRPLCYFCQRVIYHPSLRPIRSDTSSLRLTNAQECDLFQITIDCHRLMTDFFGLK